MVLVLVALIASIPRFGHRENDLLDYSDSDYYLDMAEVFAEQKSDFIPEFVESVPHHYNRPALPFLASIVGSLIGGNYRVAFSLLNICGALVIAWLLYRETLRAGLISTYAWTVPVLFLTAFPQMNWGYHVLTDTFGLATAFVASIYAVSILKAFEGQGGISSGQLLMRLVALFLLQAIAFMTRETGWFTLVVVLTWIILRKGYEARKWMVASSVVSIVLLAKVPHAVYTRYFDLAGVPLDFRLGEMFDPAYMADFLVKTAVAFNLAWIPVVYLLIKRCMPRIPTLYVGWTIAAVLYIGAGYLANRSQSIGYPLRMSFALFPVVFFLCGYWIQEKWKPSGGSARLVIALGIGYLINLAGVLLDPERGRIRVSDILEWFRTGPA